MCRYNVTYIGNHNIYVNNYHYKEISFMLGNIGPVIQNNGV